jgi:hypothetical protein
MAANVTRHSFKGYTYQHFIYCFLLSKMDVDRCFVSIDAEVDVNHNFDDIKLVCDEETVYYIQAKNYPNTEFSDIKIFNDHISIKGNISTRADDGTNIILINTNKTFPINSKILDLNAYNEGNLYVIGLDSDHIQNLIEGMYQTSTRAESMILFAYNRCTSGKFSVNVSELPSLSVFSTKLEEETLYIRHCINSINQGILCIQGKPGVGKSHFAEEIIHNYPNAIIYRFWIGSQDVNISHRRKFDNFLNDIALNIFKSSRNFTEKELIDKINNISPIIIIDGLDHIENYNKGQLDDYFRFINAIVNARVLVLTRPLTHLIEWPTIMLDNWTLDQTLIYLAKTFGFDYSTNRKIYELTDGYPIIVSFCAKHYQKYGSLNVNAPLSGLNDYYENLMSNVDTKKALSIFLLTSSFFTDKEIIKLTSEFYGDILSEYIISYPYLFERNVNRVSLIHDSLNTFLRNQITIPENMRDRVYKIIKSSIKREEIEYLSRFGDFDFDDEDFIAQILQQYSDFNVYKGILENNIDFESVKEFYQVLKLLLEERPNILNIYQYYSFILICLIVERNDFVGLQGLLYNHSKYLIRNGVDENSIFSSGLFWASYRFVRYQDSAAYLRPFYKNYYDIDSQIDEFNKAKEGEDEYFEFLSMDIDIEKALLDLSKNESDWETRDILIDIICYSYVHELDEYKLFSVVKDYIEGSNVNECEYQIYEFSARYIKEEHFKQAILPSVKDKLESLGQLREKNIYIDFSLREIILHKAKDGSFDVYSYVVAYLRLANYENRRIDIENLWMFYYMYYNRKDYSVLSLPSALLTFEKHKKITDRFSIHLIRNVMQQSEKGIRHILNEYINAKDDKFVNSCRIKDIFKDESYSYDIFNFSVSKINLLPKKMIIKRMYEEFRYHKYGKKIEFRDVKSVLHSKYQYLILEMIQYFKYSLFGVDEEQFFSIPGIKSTPLQMEKERNNIPFDHGHIHKEDIDYIKKEKISFIDISRYTDGWYSCFSIPEIYNHYPKKELRENILQIIHVSMFAKDSSLERIGLWYYYLGNLPRFLDYIECLVDWSQLFQAFISFIDLSLIPNDFSRNSSRKYKLYDV